MKITKNDIFIGLLIFFIGLLLCLFFGNTIFTIAIAIVYLAAIVGISLTITIRLLNEISKKK